MDARQFFETVEKMREAQKAYKRSRGFDTRAKRLTEELEREIDLEIARVHVVTRERMQGRIDF